MNEAVKAVGNLTYEEQCAIAGNPDKLKRFAVGLTAKAPQSPEGIWLGFNFFGLLAGVCCLWTLGTWMKGCVSVECVTPTVRSGEVVPSMFQLRDVQVVQFLEGGQYLEEPSIAIEDYYLVLPTVVVVRYCNSYVVTRYYPSSSSGVSISYLFDRLTCGHYLLPRWRLVSPASR